MTVIDVAEVLLRDVQLGGEFGQSFFALYALHDSEQLFDGGRLVCHSGIQCIPEWDTRQGQKSTPERLGVDQAAIRASLLHYMDRDVRRKRERLPSDGFIERDACD